MTLDDGQSATFYIAEMPDFTLAREFFRHGIRQDPCELNRDARAAGMQLRETVAKSRLQDAVHAMRCGKSLSFGVLTATQDGILLDGDHFGWGDVAKPTTKAVLPTGAELEDERVQRRHAELSNGDHSREPGNQLLRWYVTCRVSARIWLPGGRSDPVSPNPGWPHDFPEGEPSRCDACT
ncbi:hypothetical protein [Kitasatospora sp. MAP5-34]|uniref:hypothetical protein n=1 Tax=Kitasatospora sp. MAP5-34 TaxID=3035102 RepID=UPI0024731E37|nr:hypothetical protein [Kitasatospora sp. MAP5-34]MDH6580290.1 hypothetical protein [Kitasatospora sp. MAP5-34]